MLLAMLPARLDVPRALPAILEAWLNLSQREKARVFMTVRTRAMTTVAVSVLMPTAPAKLRHGEGLENKARASAAALRREYSVGTTRTDEGQPQELQAHQGQDGHGDPEDGLDVEGEPEEARVGRVDDARARVATLKDPLRVARLRVHLVPPAQADEAPPGNILEVVEVGGQEEDGDDEDHDPGGACQHRGRAGNGKRPTGPTRYTHMLLMIQRPRKYIKTLAVAARASANREPSSPLFLANSSA